MEIKWRYSGDTMETVRDSWRLVETDSKSECQSPNAKQNSNAGMPKGLVAGTRDRGLEIEDWRLPSE